MVPLLALAAILILVFAGDAIAPHDPTAQNLSLRLLPPFWADGGGTEHLLGTDHLGRDVLSRMIVGARPTLLIGLTTALLEAVIGITVGVTAAMRGGAVDNILMRWTDIQMGFPAPLLVLFIILLAGPSSTVVIIALAANGWMIFARISRTSTLSLMQRPFVQAAQSMGATRFHTVYRHIRPNILSLLVVVLIMETGRVILAEALLSFLGLGVQPPSVSWGSLIGEGRLYIPIAPYLSLLPGVAIIATVVSLTAVGRWAEVEFDPIRGRR